MAFFYELLCTCFARTLSMLTETFFRYFQTLWPWSWMLTSPWSWKVVVEAVVGLFCTTLLSFASSSDWSSSAEKPECLLLRTLYNNLQQNRGCWNPHYCWSVKLPEAKTLFVGNFPLKKVGGVTNLTLHFGHSINVQFPNSVRLGKCGAVVS